MTIFSRRDFLHATCLAGWAALTACSAKRSPTSGSEKARVVVLGGGFSGTTTAKYLKILDSSIKVTLVERNKFYLSCTGSNSVVANARNPKELYVNYANIVKNHAIDIVIGEIEAIHPQQALITLSDGVQLPYDRLVISTGMDIVWDAIEGYDQTASHIVPHAWKPGTQITLLRRQIRAMRNGGVIIITVPNGSYCYPIGPYERASLIASFLHQYKPRSKVLIFDTKKTFPAQTAFQQGWKELYPGIVEWVFHTEKGALKQVEVKQRTVYTPLGKYRADVLNIIPPQKANRLAEAIGLTDSTGWCPVDPISFESTFIPKIHVVGDACSVGPVSKTAFSAYLQAKLCASAIVHLLADKMPDHPSLIDHSYAFLDLENAISTTGVYGYSSDNKQFYPRFVGETTYPYVNRKKEAEDAHSWHNFFVKQVFN